MTIQESDFSNLKAAGYKFPELFKVKAADGVTDLYGVMYKPYDFDSTKVYPIIDYVYPGPQVEAVYYPFTRMSIRTDRLAQAGFKVISVGQRGGHPSRSKWYHNKVTEICAINLWHSTRQLLSSWLHDINI